MSDGESLPDKNFTKESLPEAVADESQKLTDEPVKDADFPENSESEPIEPTQEMPLEENINFVTPYAFGVSESIYGLPLAKPRKRLLAQIIDWAFIGMLTKVSYIIMFGLYAALLLSVASRLRVKQKHNLARKAIKAVGFFCLFIFSLGAIEYGFEWWSWSEAVDQQAAQSAGTVDAEQGEQVKELETVKAPELKDLDDYNWEWEKGVDDKMAGLEELADLGVDDEQEKPSELTDGLMPFLESNLTEFGISFGWAAFYFSVFAGIFAGQTPGKRLMHIKIIKQDGTDLNLWEAFGRYGGYGAGFATGLLGFLQVYWDPNRQAIQDKISGTLVIDTSKESVDL